MDSPTRLCVKNIRKASQARVLYEPMRREILRLLSKASMSQTQVAKHLDLRTPTVGHHLSILKRDGFVSIVREEPGKHGIVEKFYQSNAQFCFIDRQAVPLEIRRYYMPLDIERARGVLACAMMRQKNLDLPSAVMEDFAGAFAESISMVAHRYETSVSDKDPEVLIGRLYSEALEALLKTNFGQLRGILIP